MRVFLLDPGLAGVAGHHACSVAATVRALAERGIPATVFGHRACAPALAAQLGVVPAFSAVPYARVQARDEYRSVLEWCALNEQMERDLDALVMPAFAADDLLLMPTASAGQVYGLGLWYRRLPAPRPRACLQFMFPPGFRRPAEDAGVAAALHQRSLVPWLAEETARVVLAADNRLLAARLAALAGRPVPTLPMPIDLPPPGGASPHDSRPPVFLYLGEPRPEKGFYRLVEAIADGGGRAAGVRFVLHASGGQLAPAALAELEGVLHGAVLRNEDLTDAAYLELLAGSDAVLLPYDPREYAERSSRIFLEALALGKPVLVSAGTWMDAELDRLAGAGVRSAAFTGPAVAAALDTLAGRLPALTAAAAAAAPAVRDANRPAAFVDAVLAALA